MISWITIVFLIVDTFTFGDAIYKVSPGTYLTREGSYEQARAALEASNKEISAEILLAMAFFESRYSINAVSRIENGVRKTGIPVWRIPPVNTRSFFCGVTQASAGDSWVKCQKFHNVELAYRTTVFELIQWLSPRICNHDLRCALTGYNGGFPAIKSGNNYASSIIHRANLIKKALR